jgi:hypothetical protein
VKSRPAGLSPATCACPLPLRLAWSTLKTGDKRRFSTELSWPDAWPRAALAAKCQANLSQTSLLSWESASRKSCPSILRTSQAGIKHLPKPDVEDLGERKKEDLGLGGMGLTDRSGARVRPQHIFHLTMCAEQQGNVRAIDCTGSCCWSGWLGDLACMRLVQHPRSIAHLDVGAIEVADRDAPIIRPFPGQLASNLFAEAPTLTRARLPPTTLLKAQPDGDTWR